MNKAAELVPMLKRFRSDLQRLEVHVHNYEIDEAEALRMDLNVRRGQLERRLDKIESALPAGVIDAVSEPFVGGYNVSLLQTIQFAARGFEPLIGELQERSLEPELSQTKRWAILVLVFSAGFGLHALLPYIPVLRGFVSLTVVRQFVLAASAVVATISGRAAGTIILEDWREKWKPLVVHSLLALAGTWIGLSAWRQPPPHQPTHEVEQTKPPATPPVAAPPVEAPTPGENKNFRYEDSRSRVEAIALDNLLQHIVSRGATNATPPFSITSAMNLTCADVD